MEVTEYELGRKVWIAMGGKELSEGEIVHKFRLDWGGVHYVVQVETPVDPVLQVRDWNSISEDGKKLNMWRRIAEGRQRTRTVEKRYVAMHKEADYDHLAGWYWGPVDNDRFVGEIDGPYPTSAEAVAAMDAALKKGS